MVFGPVPKRFERPLPGDVDAVVHEAAWGDPRRVKPQMVINSALMLVSCSWTLGPCRKGLERPLQGEVDAMVREAE